MHNKAINGIIITILAGFWLIPAPRFAIAASPLEVIDEYTFAGEKNFLTGYESLNPDGTVNMVVEIPAGTNEKWEVKRPSENPHGYLKRDFKDGQPRVVEYFPYPFNYGMVPNTLLSEENGGDGDPLDVILIGIAQPRGSVHKVKIIGIVNMLDRGEIDDKLIAVLPDGPYSAITAMEELNDNFPGITTIIETFFSNYKGPNKIEVKGFQGPEDAHALLKKCLVEPLQ